jgi:DNA-3-methyladenine glycosylase I
MAHPHADARSTTMVSAEAERWPFAAGHTSGRAASVVVRARTDAARWRCKGFAVPRRCSSSAAAAPRGGLSLRAPSIRMPRKPLARCPWSLSGNDLYVRYHDTEWGVPAWDDRTQFEFLILEGAQAGLSWSTILNKREGYRKAFAGFDAEKMARFGTREVERLLGNPAIVRNRLKVEGAITNARAYLDLCEDRPFADYMWSFVDGKPIDHKLKTHRNVPVTSKESDALSKDLKRRGFKFVGSTIIYAHMQATGMVNDHLTACFRHRECAKLARRRR